MQYVAIVLLAMAFYKVSFNLNFPHFLADLMRLQHRSSQIEIFNNTVINYFVDQIDQPRQKRQEFPTFSNLNVICIAVEGDHIPVWITDNPSVVDDNGDLPVDESNVVSARRLTDYTAGLFISTITERSDINGTYQCISEESGLFTQFYLSLGEYLASLHNQNHKTLTLTVYSPQIPMHVCNSDNP